MSTLNGPFEISPYLQDTVLDADGNHVACGESPDNDEATATSNARMVCAALNAVYYFNQATRGEA